MIRKIFFSIFFISGFCSLLYQTVWLRLAFADFGVNTEVLSVVVSVFMLGLVLGSWLSGRLIRLAKNRGFDSLYFYCLAEAGIGLGALLVPKLFSFGHNLLLSFGETNSSLYLLFSALVLSLAILPWCFLMGTTIPLIADFFNRKITRDKTVFSFLYLANTFGAMAGVLITALILIELFGFYKTLVLASVFNFLIAAVSFFIIRKFKFIFAPEYEETEQNFLKLKISNKKTLPVFLLLFLTGFISMGFEVVWNRLFTPILETSVYAFAFILFVYLFGTSLGLFHYRFDLRRGKILSTKFLLLFFGAAGIVQLWLVDPKINLGVFGVILSIGSISYVLGYLTSKQIDKLSEGNPRAIGLAYAVNLFGCILGPLISSYLLMPILGTKFSIMLLCVPIIILLFGKYKIVSLDKFETGAFSLGAFLLILFTAGLGTTFEEWLNVPDKKIKNDYNATTLAATLEEDNPRSKYLMVNGVGMTMLTPITKVMAHLPLSALPEGKERKALVICFGMGTTFRSSASWGISTTAVELTPGVAKFFPYFFSDANKILNEGNNKIVIDDGRRFLERTSEKYDLIAIDPPPPVEAAGSSLLYSENFYKIVKEHLTQEGILAQWYPEKGGRTLGAVIRSLINVFPYIEIYQSVAGNGYHLLVSQSPIIIPTAEQLVLKMPPAAQADLMEWNDYNEPDLLSYVRKILAGKQDLNNLLNQNKNIKITDDRPYNEYFLLRGKD